MRIDGELVTCFEYAKVRALLAYLALESRHPQPRANLAALLWLDQPDRKARSNLSHALNTLRNALGDKDSDLPFLLADVESIQIDPRSVLELDVTQFLALLRTSETHAHRSWRTCTSCAERLRQAMALYRRDFLSEFFIPDSSTIEEWAGLQREHLLQRAVSALERLAEWMKWRGAYAEAIEYVRFSIQSSAERAPTLSAGRKILIAAVSQSDNSCTLSPASIAW